MKAPSLNVRLPLGSTASTWKKYCTFGISPVTVYVVWLRGSVATVTYPPSRHIRTS